MITDSVMIYICKICGNTQISDEKCEMCGYDELYEIERNFQAKKGDK